MPAKTPKSPVKEATEAVASISVKDVPSKAPPKPDQKAFDLKYNELTKQIDELKAELGKLRETISNNGGGDKSKQGNERQQLLDEIQKVKEEQQAHKEARGKIFDQMKASQEALKKKIDDVKSSRDKIPFKSTEEIDRKVNYLESQVASGQLKLTEEKKLLAEVSTLRKLRKSFGQFGTQEDLIDQEKKKSEELRKKLDEFEPESKRFKAEMDKLYNKLREVTSKKDEDFSKMKKMYAQRDQLSKKLDEVFKERRALSATYKAEKDAWYTWVKAEQARKNEIYKAQKAEQEKQKKLEQIQRAKELAEIPAFEIEISQCNALQTMLRQLTGASIGTASSNGATGTSSLAATGNLRQVSDEPTNLPKGVSTATALRRKTDRMDDESFFIGGKKKSKQSNKATAIENRDPKEKLKFELTVVDQFLSLGVTLPTKYGDIEKAISDLEGKKSHFLATQEQATKDNIAKAKALEEKLLKSIAAGTGSNDSVEEKENTAAVEVLAAE